MYDQFIIEKTAEHSLSPTEVSRLHQVTIEWPTELITQGLLEEIADILADRMLATMKPLTIEDIYAIQRKLKQENKDVY